MRVCVGVCVYCAFVPLPLTTVCGAEGGSLTNLAGGADGGARTAPLRSGAARAVSGSYTNLVSIPGAVCGSGTGTGSGRGEDWLRAGACVPPAPAARRSAGNMGLASGATRELLPSPPRAQTPALLPPPLLPRTFGLAAAPRTSNQ